MTAAKRLELRLSSLSTTKLAVRWSRHAFGDGFRETLGSPVAGFIAGSPDDVDFEPRVATDGKQLSSYNFRKLLEEHGVEPLEKHETGDPTRRAWTEVGDLDHYGHEHGIRLARDMETQLDQVVERVLKLPCAGWKRLRIVTGLRVAAGPRRIA